MIDFEINRMAVISLLDVTEIKTEASWSRDTKHDRNLILGFVKSYLQNFQQTQVLAKWACSVSSKMVLHVSRIRKNKHDLSETSDTEQKFLHKTTFLAKCTCFRFCATF